MKDLIWGMIGIVIAVFAAIYLAKLLRLKKSGITVDAEVVAARESKRNTYVHTLRFKVGDNECEKDDSSGYNQPFNIGEKKAIVYNPKNPDDFEYADALKKNIIIVSVLIGIALVFSARWLILGLGMI